MMITAIEVTGRRLATGMDELLRFSDKPYCTSQTDTPAFAWFNPRVNARPTLGRVLFQQTGTFGGTQVSVGNLTLSNFDGQLDYLTTDYAFDGRTIVVRYGDSSQPYAAWPVILSCKLDDVQVDGNLLNLVIHDRMKDLAKPLPRPLFAGNNVLPNGVEGTATDLINQYKPRLYGSCLNITPKCVNTSKLIYQVSDQVCTIAAAYDNGNALTKGSDYTDLNDMQTNAPTSGTFRCFQGYLRINISPVLLTCDASTTETRVAGLLQQIALDAGLASSDIASSDVAALNTLNSAPVGIWLDAETTPQQAMDLLAASIGAYYGFDRNNLLRMARLDVPAGTPVAIYDTTSVNSYRIRELGIPAPRCIVNYGHNLTVISQPAAAASTAQKAFLAEEYRQSTTTADTTIASNWPSSAEMTFTTQLNNKSDADTEAARLQSIYGARRMTIDIDVVLAKLGTVDLGNVVGVNITRYSMNTKLFILIGIDTGFAAGLAKLVLWG
jgi:hypothetical protein